ncbi:hypothetical protein [uncultured Microbacterium sp.]|uniref:hypothetical protein n=1 Tax=uncultured Microbacterium sp. TaxID=191216 RepID=UPI0028D80F2D|nr:hypothetical protein [uncultured Microbacterium sp.]
MRNSDLDAPFHGVRLRREVTSAAMTAAEGEIAADASAVAVAARFHRAVLAARARAFARVCPPHMFFRGVTAGVVWGVPLPLRCVNPDAHARLSRREGLALDRDSPRPLDTAVLPPHRASRASGVNGRQLSEALTVVQEYDGLRVVSPATLWTQLAQELTVDELIVVGDALVHEPRRSDGSRAPAGSGRTTLGRLEAALNAGRRVGAAKLREALPQIRVGGASSAETDLRLALIRAGLPDAVLDYDVVGLRGEFIGYTEFAYPAFRLLLEYEGDHHRTDRAQWNRDIEKHAAATAAGCTVLRLTSRHLYPHAAPAVEQVRQALLRAGWRP